MATTATKLMTVDELLAIPREDYRGYRYELIRGELTKTRMFAGIAHGAYAIRIAANLLVHADDHNLGMVVGAEAAFRLATNPDHARIPDVGFIRQERVRPLDEMTGALDGAPDLAVEIISPSDRLTRVRDKVADWLNHGTLMVIVVNPRDRTVNVHTPAGVRTLTETDTLDGDDVVPDWRMPVADIFA